ncbi:hypothetical protein HYFRA_00011961 [Hymenoscyphus fraxineus]|uniref:N-acetyltransferase domain-containing protein n=1 Tax=Hymenoscyphus fraxineus TaxID=746836 RepID=A0A9N9KYA4_9HELO|nr:hypothetical protein HYFRA_00011961 [Hymenoscyphus fraxineus]
MADYYLKEVKTREEHDALIELTFQVWNDPSITSLIRLNHGPFLGESPSDIEATISIDKERSWNAHQSDPASHKTIVMHVPTGEVVGSLCWKVYTSAPFPDGAPRIQLPYWSENDKEGRECSEEILTQCFYPRASWMNTPMIAMDDTSVRQDHQRKGIGSLMLEWGMKKAEELSVECYVEATDAGRHLYQKYGFAILMKVLVDAENGTSERHEMIQKLTPQPTQYWAMWRPNGGVVKDGAPRTLWEAIEARKK